MIYYWYRINFILLNSFLYIILLVKHYIYVIYWISLFPLPYFQVLSVSKGMVVKTHPTNLFVLVYKLFFFIISHYSLHTTHNNSLISLSLSLGTHSFFLSFLSLPNPLISLFYISSSSFLFTSFSYISIANLYIYKYISSIYRLLFEFWDFKHQDLWCLHVKF